MKTTPLANRLAMWLIVLCTTASWIGTLAGICFATEKRVFGGGLPDWISLTALLLGASVIILTFLISVRVLFDPREPCGLKDLLAIWYGYSVIGAFLLIDFTSNGG